MPPGPPPGAPRRSLRRKGLVLFVAVSAYVVGGSGLLVVAGTMISPTGMPGLGEAAVLAGVVVLLGLAVFGAFLTLFLGRLAADVGRLQARALQVAHGERSAPLDMDRDDEVGSLARAVDKMASDLVAREAEIAATRLEQFHSERMMLLGGIAAGMAHEIGNPVAALVAIARDLAAAQRSGRPPEVPLQELVAQADRLSAVTRRLAVVAGWRSRQAGPLALNPLLESIVALVTLDRRFHGVRVSLEADAAIPAVHAAEDDIVQLVMHLVVNAAEALAGTGGRTRRIRVATARRGAEVELSVADNGCGMDAETLRRAPDPLFTTKPAGRGNGLGLDACYRVMERCGGSIALRSEPGEGTTVVCRFPSMSRAADVVDSRARSPS